MRRVFGGEVLHIRLRYRGSVVVGDIVRFPAQRSRHPPGRRPPHVGFEVMPAPVSCHETTGSSLVHLLPDAGVFVELAHVTHELPAQLEPSDWRDE